MSPLDVARSRFTPDGYSLETHVDIEELEKMDQLAPPPAQTPPGEEVPPAVDAPGNEADRAG